MMAARDLKDPQSNFGMETIRTLSDEETGARGEINELLSLGDITRDFPAVIDNHPIGPGPSFSLVHRRFLCVRSGINQKVWVRKTDIAVSSPLPFGKPLIYSRCRRQPLASCKVIQMLPFIFPPFV